MATRLRLLETATVLGIGFCIAVIIGKAAVSFSDRPAMFFLLAAICFATVGSQALYSLAAGKRFRIWCSSGGALVTFLCLFVTVVALSPPISPITKFIAAGGMLIACPVLSWVAERSKICEPDRDHRSRFDEV